MPVLGLIFLRYADQRFTAAEKELATQASARRQVSEIDYQARGVMYLPPEARYGYLLNLPEGQDIGRALNDAMRAIEEKNPDLAGVLPHNYTTLENASLVELLKLFASVPMDIEGDAFGKIYEYFLGNFAMSEGRKGGEFFTPTSLVKLIVEVIEPFHGRIFDPACGSGGMFVQSAKFVENHQHNAERRNLDLRRGAGRRDGASLHDEPGGPRPERRDQAGKQLLRRPARSAHRFDFVMANPPFNVNNVDKEKMKDDPRFPFGMPSCR